MANQGKISVEKVERPKLAKHDSKMLDLAFAMDCTGSMGSYIESARSNIRMIVEEIVASEKSNVRLALVEYRDHPPQDSSFVTRVHDFTGSPGTMKGWLDNCSADGGGDTPEAVADALHDVLKLSWRDEATKICVCISDAPPHGLGCIGDGFPDGCPNDIDPMTVAHQLTEKGITIYMVGCEPSITPYKDFFMAVAFITGGQYVPLGKSQLLSKVIIGGAQEEMSLEELMAEVDLEVQAEVAAGREIDEAEMATRMQAKWQSRGEKTKHLQRNNASLATAESSPVAKKLSNMKSMGEVRSAYKPEDGSSFGSARGGAPRAFMAACPLPPGCPTPRMRPMPPMKCGAPIMMCDAPEIMCEAKEMMPSAAEGESYDCVESDISYAQSSRMVQKAIVRNFAKKKSS